MPFSDFQGNAAVVHTLREMLAREHFPHALILSGWQGSGKFTLSQMLAKAMNCLERPLSDGHPDLLIIPPDPPQMLVKVDQVRYVIQEIYYKPAEGRERVYIFSDAEFMKEAANSLLKVLEEPPEFATLFLLTDNPSALLPTIRSRCMHLRLAPLSAPEVDS